MTDYDFAYSLASTPSASLDGSGVVRWDIWAVAQPEGADPPAWTPVPGRHQTVQTPAADLAVINAMPDSTGAQKQAKNTAYKQLLVDSLSVQGVAVVGWAPEQLEALMDANDAAAAAAADVDDYIVNVISQTYPLRFTL